MCCCSTCGGPLCAHSVVQRTGCGGPCGIRGSCRPKRGSAPSRPLRQRGAVDKRMLHKMNLQESYSFRRTEQTS